MKKMDGPEAQDGYKMWGNDVQKDIKSAKLYKNKVADLELDHSACRNWWNHIKRTAQILTELPRYALSLK